MPGAERYGALASTVTESPGECRFGATVNMTSAETGRLSTTTTNELGYYNGVGTSAGELPCRRCSKGIQKISRRWNLHVAQLGVADFSVGGPAKLTETITFGGWIAGDQSTGSALGTVIEAKQIEELPLNGRNLPSLLRNTGGH